MRVRRRPRLPEQMGRVEVRPRRSWRSAKLGVVWIALMAIVAALGMQPNSGGRLLEELSRIARWRPEPPRPPPPPAPPPSPAPSRHAVVERRTPEDQERAKAIARADDAEPSLEPAPKRTPSLNLKGRRLHPVIQRTPHSNGVDHTDRWPTAR